MNTKFVRLALLGAALFAGNLASLSAAEPPKEIANKIFESLEKRDYDQFIADADAGWKKNAPKGAFDGIANMVAPKMKDGYESAYLGELKGPGGTQQTLWKLTMKGTGEEMLVAIYLKDGKVSRFGFPK